jgi:hypothetical protein
MYLDLVPAELPEVHALQERFHRFVQRDPEQP